jgi:uncharacterized protein YjbI with pentapeptide repeats
MNVICAYLRMPFTNPPPPGKKFTAKDQARLNELFQENQVRLTAQRMLHTHRSDPEHWTVGTIDKGAILKGAILAGADLADANLPDAPTELSAPGDE